MLFRSVAFFIRIAVFDHISGAVKGYYINYLGIKNFSYFFSYQIINSLHIHFLS